MSAVSPASRVRLLDLIIQLFLDGPAIAHDDVDFHRTRIEWEWDSGQWAMLTGKDDRLWGWMSYYRVTDEVLEIIGKLDFDALFKRQGGALVDLTSGPNIYFATIVIAPWAPVGMMSRMATAVMERNRDAVSVSWHRRFDDGRSRFIHQPPDPLI